MTQQFATYATADAWQPVEAETGAFRLTPTQLGMIYESVIAERPWINLEQLVIHMDDEPVDQPAMAEAWRHLAARHDALRTVFSWRGEGQPTQCVLPAVDDALEIVDLTDSPRDRQQASLRDWLQRDRLRGVDLTRAPGWRVTWFVMARNRSVLVWTFHHAMLDGRSFTALLAEVLDDYSARRADPGAAMATGQARRPRFRDHCTALDAVDLSAAERHFRAALSGFDAANRIDIAPAAALDGADDPTPATPSRKQLIEQTLPKALGDQLAARATTIQVTVATLVMAAWGIVTARCSGRAEAVFGTTRAGRHLVPGASDMIGCLINTLPVRVATSSRMTVDEVLHTLRRDQIAARPHEHTPLTEIARWTDLPGGTALFDSAVIFERGSLNRILRARGGVWASRHIEVLEEGALPLTLAVYQDEEMLFRLEHDPGRFDTGVARRLLDYTLAVLRGIALMPGDTPLADLGMLPGDETAELLALASSGGDGRTADRPSCIVGAFEARATGAPDRIALTQVGACETVTYRQLDARADRLARLMGDAGVGAGDLVAICLPRSPEFVIAALAVMKSGAAFLPVDPAYPADVIDHMLGDSRACILLTSCASAPPGGKIPTVLLDGAAQSSEPPDRPAGRATASPDRTAYVIYTSGSTGTPKGVMVSHRSLAAHIGAITGTYGLGPRDRVLQFASPSFDVSIEEIFPTLLCGAVLVLRDPEMAESISGFLERTHAFGLTVLNLPTAFWHTLVDHLDATGARLPASVRLVIVGGEAVSPKALARWQAIHPDIRWLNGYGPTEATITTTVFDPARSATLAEDEDVPIGRPLDHTRAYVLTQDATLAPKGARGELWLGGVAVAQGYRFRPELTGQKFRTDPFAEQTPKLPQSRPGDRMYRTGDLVRWRPDGTLGFAGRMDRQVKVNGFRIELRQIEKALESFPGIGLALASVDAPGTPGARLRAWVTPSVRGQTPDPALVRAHLSSRLPPYMVPALAVVDAFPKTPGGKIDLRALPRPAISARGDPPAAEANATARRIAGIFGDILGLPDVGPDDSFFDLGGHSLLAVRLIGSIESSFGRRLTISTLHFGPTPRQIARALEMPVPDAAPEFVVPIQPAGTRPPIYGVHVLGSNECFFRPLADRLGPDQPVFGLTVGPLTGDSPTGVAETAALYRQSIERHHPTGPLSLAAVSQGSYIAFELAQQLLKAGRDVTVLALFDAAGPGGRNRLEGTDRLRAHLRQLWRVGPAYLAVVAQNRIDNLRNSIETFRLRRARRTGAHEMSNPTVGAFVAANTLAIKSYRARPYPRPLVVFRAQDSVFDAPDAIASGLGWREVAGGGLRLIEVPGGHLSMLAPPHVETLAQRLSAVLNPVRRDTKRVDPERPTP